MVREHAGWLPTVGRKEKLLGSGIQCLALNILGKKNPIKLHLKPLVKSHLISEIYSQTGIVLLSIPNKSLL